MLLCRDVAVMNTNAFNSSCYFSVTGCVLPVTEEAARVDIIHSDQLNLYVAPSLLPIRNVGHGVFARSNIPAGSVLAVCRGPVKWNARTASSDRDSHMISFGNGSYIFQFTDDICQHINDIVDVKAFPSPTLSGHGDEDMPLLPGFSYNSVQSQHWTIHCVMISTVDIPAGAEVFHSFGS